MCKDKYGCLPILHLLSPRKPAYFDPVTIKLYEFPTAGKPTCTSKKPDDVRRSELLHALVPMLYDLCVENASEMMCHPFGSRIINELYFLDGDYLTSEQHKGLADAMAQAVVDTDPSEDSAHGKAGMEDAKEDEDAGPAVSLIGHKLIQKMLQKEQEEGGEQTMWVSAFSKMHEFENPEKRLMAWCRHNRMAFVLISMVKCAPKERVSAVKDFLKKSVKSVSDELKGESSAGLQKLVEILA